MADQPADKPAERPALELRSIRLLEADAPRELQPVILRAGAKPRKQWRLEVHAGLAGSVETARFVLGGLEGSSAGGFGRMCLALANALINPDLMMAPATAAPAGNDQAPELAPAAGAQPVTDRAPEAADAAQG